jgi:hypothetical protein
MICIILTQATDGKYGKYRWSAYDSSTWLRDVTVSLGVCTNVVDTKPYVFIFAKVTLEQVEKFWIELYNLASARNRLLPAISSDNYRCLALRTCHSLADVDCTDA